MCVHAGVRGDWIGSLHGRSHSQTLQVHFMQFALPVCLSTFVLLQAVMSADETHTKQGKM